MLRHRGLKAAAHPRLPDVHVVLYAQLRDELEIFSAEHPACIMQRRSNACSQVSTQSEPIVKIRQ